jgi:hypothetical protein
MPSISNCRFVMGLLQASHTPPSSSWGPPHDWAMVAGCPGWIPKIWSKLTIRATDHRGARLRRMLHAPGTTARSTPSVPGSTRWWGIGHDVVGMARQGFDLQLTRYDDSGWRASFYTTGMEHSPTSAAGPGGSARRGMRRSGRRGKR